MKQAIFNGVTLWLGMYAITCTLFYIETGSLAKGALLGLLSATLKTIWGIIHKVSIAQKPVEAKPSGEAVKVVAGTVGTGEGIAA